MKLGFIGCGNMAQAMIKGIVSKGIMNCEDIIASDAYRPGLENANRLYGIRMAETTQKLWKMQM